MEIINNINQYNDMLFILNNIQNLKKSKDNELCYIKIIDILYKTEKKRIYNYLKIALEVQHKNKYSDIQELYDVSNDFIRCLKKIKYFQNIEQLLQYIKQFSDTVDEFESYYFKLLDPMYKKFLSLNKNICILLQINLTNRSNNKIKTELINNLKNIYNLHPFFAVQLICKKSQFLFRCDQTIYNESWGFISDAFEQNNYFTLYILIIELRKLLIDNIEDPLLKKNLYYNIDIESIKYALQFGISNDDIFKKCLDIFKDIYKVEHKNFDIKTCFHDLTLIYHLFCKNEYNKYNVLKNDLI